MLYYLASPYSSPYKAVEHYRYLEACRAADRLIQRGMVVFSPVVHCHPIRQISDRLGGNWEAWAAYNQVYLEKADALLVLTIDGWAESFGVKQERKYFMEAGKPYLTVDPITYELRPYAI